MGNLLDYHQSTQAAPASRGDQTEQDKEKAVEEAAALERDIDTLANEFGKSCSVVLLGPVLHVTDVGEGVGRELKIEVGYDGTATGSGFSYAVEENEKHTIYTADKFYPFMISWLRGA